MVSLEKWYSMERAKEGFDGQDLENAIVEIYPYKHKGTWVFDDERVGLYKEPFVLGVPEMIDHLVKDVPNAQKGFKLLFSILPFPQFDQAIDKTRAEFSGTWYQMNKPPHLEGWLCSALFKYFPVAPETLYVKAFPLTEDKPWWRVW